MAYPYYRGLAGDRPNEPQALPPVRRDHFEDAKDYYPDPGLVDAINVALLLGQPLLLTGEPGTGKTQAAYSLAWELGFDEPLKFETKSSSTATDLFYTYDSLKRFQDAHESKQGKQSLDYITYNALGRAILKACPKEQVAAFLPADFKHDGPQRTIVLIDEVDKAPRDFPNDILNELENMYFRIPELGSEYPRADPEMRPVVIITSNSEKDLPDAFLRRCVYYNIPFPGDKQLKRIIAARLALSGGAGDPLLRDALALFRLLRSPETGLRKRPATAELLGWLKALRAMSDLPNPLANRELIFRTLGTLVKNAEDVPKAAETVEQWVAEAGPKGDSPRAVPAANEE